MWNFPKGEDFLPEVSLRKLKKLYDCEVKAKPKMRLLAAVHRKNGKSLDDIAYVLHVPRNTAYGWLRRFMKRGVSAKDSIKQTGKTPILSESQRRRLVADLERGPLYNHGGLWSTKEVSDLLQKKYKVKFVNQHVWRMLDNLGFSLQRPRKRHYQKPDDETINKFKKKRGGSHGYTEPKGLLWARRMRQHSA